MGSVIQLKPKSHGFAHSLTFTEADEDYGNLHDAKAYLKARGFSYGQSQSNADIGILYGDCTIAKWRNLDAEERNDLHGVIKSHDFRRGAVTVVIRADAPADAIAAFHLEDVSGDGRPDAGMMTGAEADEDEAARRHVEKCDAFVADFGD